MAHPSPSMHDRWEVADPYERYVGRWSRRVASEFVRWLAVEPRGAWADIGCGTGALTEAVLRECDPVSVRAIDKSPGFVASASARVPDPRARFEVAEATRLPLEDACCAAVVSGLVLNFVERPAAMVEEMARVARPAGQVAAYVWDYAGGMQMMRHFWDAAVATCGPDAPDEGRRFPVCAPEPLQALWTAAGLSGVEVRAIVVPTEFASFDDYWQPFLGGQGPAPAWLAALPPEQREAVRDLLQRQLPTAPDGGIRLTAAAWAVKGRRS